MTDTKAEFEAAKARDGVARQNVVRAEAALKFARGFAEQAAYDLDVAAQKHIAATAPPVDRTAVQLTTGEPVPADRSHTEIDPASGQQKGYVVLTPAERAKGFKRPVRQTYKHLTCGRVTSMGRALCETYARDPFFYSGTFCTPCGKHFPTGEDGEFVWIEADGSDGPKVGT